MQENLTNVSFDINFLLIDYIPGRNYFLLKPYFRNWTEVLTLGENKWEKLVMTLLKPPLHQ